MWKQRLGEDLGTSSIFHNCNGFWYIDIKEAKEDFDEKEGFFASNKEDLVSPPARSWDFWIGEDISLSIKGEKMMRKARLTY